MSRGLDEHLADSRDPQGAPSVGARELSPYQQLNQWIMEHPGRHPHAFPGGSGHIASSAGRV